ncbi:hypothetical protein TNCV_986771 [Trichonephila clavipes]|nr:hypothetical protein TNCV_986771 [Trichonephila clavipes]
MLVKSVEAQNSHVGVVWKIRGVVCGLSHRYCSRHLTEAQNYECSQARHGHGSLVIKVTDSLLACREFEARATEDPSCRDQMHAKSAEIQTSSRWCGVEVRRGRYQLRCRPLHLTMVQNYEICRQKLSSSPIVRR